MCAERLVVGWKEHCTGNSEIGILVPAQPLTSHKIWDSVSSSMKWGGWLKDDDDDNCNHCWQLQVLVHNMSQTLS